MGVSVGTTSVTVSASGLTASASVYVFGSTADPTVLPADSSVDSDGIPVCSILGVPKPQWMLSPQARAYCRAIPPIGTEVAVVDSAIARIRAKGGACVGLAALADTLRANGQFKFYNSASSDNFSGAVDSIGHGGTGDVIISRYWLGHADAAHATTVGGTELVSRDLQHVIAHELDHLAGESHLSTSGAGLFNTAHSSACSDIP